MSDINEIKQRNERHKQLQGSGSSSDSKQFLADVYELKDVTRNITGDIDYLITTIESQQEKHREELQVLMNSSNIKIWNLQDVVKEKDSLIESQKEEIEKLNEVVRTLGLSLQNALPQEGDSE